MQVINIFVSEECIYIEGGTLLHVINNCYAAEVMSISGTTDDHRKSIKACCI